MSLFHHEMSLSEVTDQEETDANHANILQRFIKQYQGMKGMLLVAIRNQPGATAIEVTGGAAPRDSVRAALCILEGLLAVEESSGVAITDDDKREVLQSVVSVLTKLTEDQSSGVVVLQEDEDGRFHDVTRRGPGLEDDDDQTRH